MRTQGPQFCKGLCFLASWEQTGPSWACPCLAGDSDYEDDIRILAGAWKPRSSPQKWDETPVLPCPWRNLEKGAVPVKHPGLGRLYSEHPDSRTTGGSPSLDKRLRDEGSPSLGTLKVGVSVQREASKRVLIATLFHEAEITGCSGTIFFFP